MYIVYFHIVVVVFRGSNILYTVLDIDLLEIDLLDIDLL